MLISGSPTSSPINTSSCRPFSSARIPSTSFGRASGRTPFLGREESGLTLVLRFSFCDPVERGDDLFFTVISPFLPDDILHESLRLKYKMEFDHPRFKTIAIVSKT